jgi:hypothetical protein
MQGGVNNFKLPFFIIVFLCSILTFSLNNLPLSNCSNMPLVVDDDPYLASIYDAPPVEQRGPEYKRWLQNSFKIRVPGASGSGTLCWYDRGTNTAWVISCGHLWSGTRSAQSLRSDPPNGVFISTWYQNDIKLPRARSYLAKVHFYSNRDGYDISLLSFNPDWIPEGYFPIAPPNYVVRPGQMAHSMGCDKGSEVAHYSVEIIGRRGEDLVTRRNSPRAGRSGGGLVDDSGYYIGICWGTSDYSGTGVGYFTPLPAINQHFQNEGFGFLLNRPPPFNARRIPIYDHMKPGTQYPPEYIPLPGRAILRY